MDDIINFLQNELAVLALLAVLAALLALFFTIPALSNYLKKARLSALPDTTKKPSESAKPTRKVLVTPKRLKILFAVIATLIIFSGIGLVWLNSRPSPQLQLISSIPSTGEYLSQSGNIVSISKISNQINLKVGDPLTHTTKIKTFRVDENTQLIDTSPTANDVEIKGGFLVSKTNKKGQRDFTELEVGTQVTIYYPREQKGLDKLTAAIIKVARIPVPEPAKQQ